MTAAENAAARAYERAAAIDRRLPSATRDRIAAWAELFAAANVGAEDAVAAVQQYYRDPSNAYSIMPSNIIALVAAMPPTSSEHRFRAFIAKWVAHPYSGQVQLVTGLEWSADDYPPPPEIYGDTEAERAYHMERLKEAVRDNWSDIARRVVSKPT
ncbi:hypothetical protein AB0E01_22655 [Nocardia vinacea]|uniref:hypothetical protein n=1 Tax=Nocardia vinacea TaxID=96468 RepID=UPI0033CA4F3A